MPKSNHTNYIHAWHKSPHLAPYAMASIDDSMPSDARQTAKALGFRTFRIIDELSQIQHGEIICPASKHSPTRDTLAIGGMPVTCNTCTLCDGKKGESDTRKDIVEIKH